MSEVISVREVGPPGLEIAEELGRGAQTVVYRARRQGVDYALKMLRQSVYADDAAWVAFRREAATLTSVAHPGLTRIHEVGQADGRPYLVMELVDGQTLTGLLEAGPLDEARVALEPGGRGGTLVVQQHLDRDEPVQAVLAGAVDDAVAAPRDEREVTVAGQVEIDGPGVRRGDGVRRPDFVGRGPALGLGN